MKRSMSFGGFWAVVALAIAGCGSSGGAGSDFKIAADGGEADLTKAPMPDLVQIADLSQLPDLTMPPPDLARPPVDLAMPMVCNKTVDVSLGVQAQQVAQDPPQPVGGQFVPGRYIISSAIFYTGPNGMMGPTGPKNFQTLEFGNGTYDVVAHSDQDPEQRTSGQYVVANGQFSISSTCPQQSPLMGYDYDATPNSFTIHVTSQGMTALFTYVAK